MHIAVLSGFALSLAAPWVYRLGRGATGWLLALLPLGLLVYFLQFVGVVTAGDAAGVSFSWIPQLNVSFAFQVDGLSLLFVLLICGIGALILIYAGGYLAGHPQLGRFYTFLLIFMASMLGLVLANDLITLFVFWELTTISSYLLIGFNHERMASRAAALQGMLVTGTGGLLMLAGLVLLAIITGTSTISELVAQRELILASPLYLPALALVLLGAFTKSAQFPFHFWLPGAMEAPTPVSAYLHSATMVKAGIYLLARMSPIIGGTPAWFTSVTTVGLITLLVGGVVALYQTDLKRLLAYSTISALGTLTLLLGIGGAHAIEAMVVFLLAHALYKGALFMIAGSVDHETGTRDVEQLGGLRHTMPITAAVAVMAAISLGGFGPVISFIGKELLLEAALEVEQWNWVLVPAVTFGGALFVAVAAIVTLRTFFGKPGHPPKHPHEAPPSMWLGPGILALAGFIFGLAPILVEVSIVEPAMTAITGEFTDISLYLWHGFNLALGLSVLSVVTGLGLYFGWVALRRTTPWAEIVFSYGPSRWYTALVDGMNWLARAQTRLLQNGYLHVYLLVIMVTAVALVGTTMLLKIGLPPLVGLGDVRFYEAGLLVLMLLAAISAIFLPSRLSIIAALGVVGYGVALIYVLYGAPDLAMTQILVETLTVVLFVLVFYHLPRFTRQPGTGRRLRDILIAGSVGVLMTLLVLADNTTPPESQLTPFFAEASKPEAHGSNIVNVILVDFRGLDTLGEITVLSIAAIGVFALLRLRPRKGDSK